MEDRRGTELGTQIAMGYRKTQRVRITILPVRERISYRRKEPTSAGAEVMKPSERVHMNSDKTVVFVQGER